MTQQKPEESTTYIRFLSLLRVQDDIVLPGNIVLCFECPEDGDLHKPSQPTYSHFIYW